MEGLISDLRFAVRQLLRRPGSSLTAVLTLALGTGAATAMFAIVDHVLLRPLPFSEPGRLVALCETNPSLEGFCVASPPDAEDWARASRTLVSVGLGRTWPFSMRGDKGSEGVAGGLATPGLFRTLRLSPDLGRLLGPEDLTPSGRHVAVLSHAFWMSRFGGDRSILGRTLLLDGERYDVVGVLGAGDVIPLLSSVQVWAPLPFDPRDEENRGWRGFVTIARLAPGIRLATAQQELRAIQGRLAERHPDTNRGWGARMEPLLDRVVGPVRPTLLVFLGAVGILMLVAVTNVTNLLVARALAREKELAIRSAVGAGRPRLVRLLAIEGLVLAAIGGLAGVLVAAWATDGLLHLIPDGLPRVSHIGLDARVLGFSLGLTLVVGVLAPLGPALRATRLDLTTVLKQGPGSRGWRTALGLRGALVVAQVSTAFVLAIGAGLLTRSFVSLLQWQPGFERSHLLTFWTLASTGRYPLARDMAALFSRLEGELRSLPGVDGVGMASSGPLFGGKETGEFFADGNRGADHLVAARRYDMSAGFFPTLGVALRRGRFFTEADRAGAPPVALLNETMAHRLFGSANPIGRRIRERGGRTMEIVGVVADIPPFTPGVPAPPEVYWPYQQSPRWASYFLLRTSVEPAGLARSVEGRLTTVDPDLRPAQLETMDQLVDDELARPRFQMVLIGLFSLAALTLALVGVYGVLAALVTARTPEIGVRLALGAGSRRVVGLVVRQGMALVGVGIGVGAIAALGISRFAAALLHGVRAGDPLTYGVIVTLVGGAAGMACLVPAARAARVDPVSSLRAE